MGKFVKYGGVPRTADLDMSIDKISGGFGPWSSIIYRRRLLGWCHIAFFDCIPAAGAFLI